MKEQIHTKMIGRHVLLAKSLKQHGDTPYSGPVPIIQEKYEKHGGASGEVVNVYLKDGTVNYDVVLGGGDLLIGLTASNIQKVL